MGHPILPTEKAIGIICLREIVGWTVPRTAQALGVSYGAVNHYAPGVYAAQRAACEHTHTRRLSNGPTYCLGCKRFVAAAVLPKRHRAGAPAHG